MSQEDLLSQIYSPQVPATQTDPPGILKKIAPMLAGRLGISLLCTAVVGFITNSPFLWKSLRVMCSFIGLMGDEKVTNKVTTLFNTGEQEVRAHVEKTATEAPKPPLKEMIVEKARGKVFEPVKEAVSDAKDQAKETVTKAKDEVKGAVDRVGDKLAGLGKGDDGPAEEEKGAAEKLVDLTKEAGNKVAAGGTAVASKAGQIRDEMAEQQKRAMEAQKKLSHWSFSMCPRCKGPMKIPERSKPTSFSRCHSCGASVTAAQIRMSARGGMR